MAANSFGKLHITRILLLDPVQRAYSLDIAIQGQKTSNAVWISQSVAVDSDWRNVFPLLEFTQSEFETIAIAIHLTIAKKDSHLPKKNALKISFPTLKLEDIVFKLSSDENSDPLLLKAFADSDEIELSIYAHFSGKDFVNWQMRDTIRTWKAIEALEETKQNISLILPYATHRPILERIIELTHECVISSKKMKSQRRSLSELWLLFGESSNFPKFFDSLPEISLYLLGIIKEDKMIHIERYQCLYPMIRHGLNMPVGRKMVGLLISLLEDSMKLSIKMYAEQSVDSSSLSINNEVKTTKKAKQSQTMENVASHCSDLLALLAFCDPKYCPHLATKTNLIPLCRSILEINLFGLHTSVFSLLRWFGRAHEPQLEHHGIFSLLSDRTLDPLYAPRIVDTFALLEQFGRSNNENSFSVICSALNSDLPAIRIKHFLNLILKELLSGKKITDDDLVMATNAVLKILSLSTLSDAKDVFRELTLPKRMSCTTFLRTKFLTHYFKAFELQQTQILDFSNVFKHFILDELLMTPQRREAHLSNIFGPFQEAGFWECMSNIYRSLSNLQPDFIRSKSPQWAFSSNSVFISLDTVYSLLTHGSIEVIEAALRANFFESFVSFVPLSHLFYPTIGESYTAYIGFIYVMDRVISMAEPTEGKKVQDLFISELLRNPLHGSILTNLPNIKVYFPTHREWMTLVTKYCELDSRLELFFAHYSAFQCRGLTTLASELAEPFIKRFMETYPKMKAIQAFFPQASEILQSPFSNPSKPTENAKEAQKGPKKVLKFRSDVERGLKLENSLLDSSSTSEEDSVSTDNEKKVEEDVYEVESMAIKDRPSLPDVFEFYDLCCDEMGAKHYLKVAKRLFAMLSASSMVGRPIALSWVVWHIEMTFSVLDHCDQLCSPGNMPQSMRHSTFREQSKEILDQWGKIMPHFCKSPLRLLQVSSWPKIWPHTTRWLFSIYRKSNRMNFSSDNLSKLQSIYLSNFMTSSPPMKLFDMFQDEGLAVGIFEQMMESTSATTVRESPFFLFGLSMVLNDSLKDFDPRFLVEIEKASIESKHLLQSTPYAIRTGIGQGPLQGLSSSIMKVLSCLPSLNPAANGINLRCLDFNRFIVDVDMRYFASVHLLKLLDFMDIEIVIPTWGSMNLISPILFNYLMDPVPEIASLAWNIYEKLGNEMSGFLFTIRTHSSFQIVSNERLWAYFMNRPSDIRRWINLIKGSMDTYERHIATTNLVPNGGHNIQFLQNEMKIQISSLLLEYCVQFELFATNPEKWIQNMDIATIEYEEMVQERYSSRMAFPSHRNQLFPWVMSRISQPKLEYSHKIKIPMRVEKKGQISFSERVGSFTHFPSNPSLITQTFLEIIHQCMDILPTATITHWSMEIAAPRRGIAYIPHHLDPSTIEPTSEFMTPGINFDSNPPKKEPIPSSSSTISTPSSTESIPSAITIFKDWRLGNAWLSIHECIQRCLVSLSSALTLIPHSEFPLDIDAPISDVKETDECYKDVKREEMTIDLICRIFSFCVNLEIKPESGILIPLKRYLRSYAMASERNFASNKIIGEWSEYLYCVTKSIVTRFIGFEDNTLPFELTLRDHIISRLRATAIYTNGDATQMLLEILFLLVKTNWNYHENAVIPDLEFRINGLSSSMAVIGKSPNFRNVKTLSTILTRIFAFLALYRPSGPAPLPTNLDTYQSNLPGPPVRIAYFLEFDDSIHLPSNSTPSSSNNLSSPKGQDIAIDKVETSISSQSKSIQNSKSEEKNAPSPPSMDPPSNVTLQPSSHLWNLALYQLADHSKQRVCSKGGFPFFFSQALYDRLVAITSSPKE